MILKRYNLADIPGPMRLAQSVHDLRGHTKGAVPVQDIASSLDVADIRIQSFDGFEGMLLTDNRRRYGAILANNSKSERRTRFTIAHELGHFLLERHILSAENGFSCRAADLSQNTIKAQSLHKRQEAEANRFAACLLAPQHLMRPVFSKEPRLEDAIALVRILDISLEVAVRRMIDLRDEPLAAIWSWNGTVRYAIRAKGFPFLTCRPKGTLPKDSAAARHVAAGRSGLTSFEEALPYRWVDAANAQIFEQTRMGRNGYAVTLLWQTDIPEPDDDDGALDELTMPRFR